MTKIPFKVSARTAKLIGQENFSNPEGATIELVKNCYDADAKNCLVVYDILFDSIPETLSAKDFKSYSQENEVLLFIQLNLHHGQW
jgi:peptidyl-tRNA hydrolase